MTLIGMASAQNMSDGGVYQYSLTMAEELPRVLLETGMGNLVLLVGSGDLPRSWPQGLQLQAFDPTMASRLAKLLIPSRSIRTALIRARSAKTAKEPLPGQSPTQPRLAKWHKELGIDLIVYPSLNPRCVETDVPFIMAVHDVQHRLQPQFREVGSGREAQLRDRIIAFAARKAALILADSAVGKEDLLTYYAKDGLTEDIVRVLPFLPSSALRRSVTPDELRFVRARYELPDRFLFYPAQFWPHKNHFKLAEALALLHDRGEKIQIVLSGSRSGYLQAEAYRRFRRFLAEKRLESHVRHLGMIPEEDMAPLYVASQGLVFPTMFGPTNIPIIEAWIHGVPVMTSDIRGVREQVGPAAILVDPCSYEAIAEGISTLWSDQARCAELVRKGRERTNSYRTEHYRSMLEGIMRDGLSRLRN